ncbi:acetyltransferase [Caldimonas brevitalea]|uniref:Acetyltransferase n=1 Tax=Caldimonas brevitalea TaxID=413882 RepID=A0A0G3BJB4_9BURK|nr:acetyltransferase [Caldimonas brevitalea]
MASLEPTLQDGMYVFASLPAGSGWLGVVEPLATFREREGLSVVVEASVAEAAGWPVLFRAAWITLSVHSDLHAVGLTAAVSTALTEAGISCNMVAAACHDHLFVPWDARQASLEVLHALQREGSARRVVPA